MSRISDIGEKILRIQTRFGLENPGNYRPGLNATELEASALLQNVRPPSELHDLFTWKNGAVEDDTPMGRLWIKPGFYLMSVNKSVLENRYCSEHYTDWRRSWFPLLTNGAAGRQFCDIEKTSAGRFSVMDYDPESKPVVSQVYDSIESMLATVLACYENGVYFFASDGYLDSDFPREVEMARRLNPHSEYWQRDNLF